MGSQPAGETCQPACWGPAGGPLAALEEPLIDHEVPLAKPSSPRPTSLSYDRGIRSRWKLGGHPRRCWNICFLSRALLSSCAVHLIQREVLHIKFSPRSQASSSPTISGTQRAPSLTPLGVCGVRGRGRALCTLHWAVSQRPVPGAHTTPSVRPRGPWREVPQGGTAQRLVRSHSTGSSRFMGLLGAKILGFERSLPNFRLLSHYG